MALEVASMLDELCVNSDWLEKSAVALNEGLSKLKVSTGYSILVTIASRSYLVASDSKGTLTVKVVPNHAACIEKAVKKANCRAIMEVAALTAEAKEGKEYFDWQKKMAMERKMHFQGNVGSFNDLVKELGPHIGMLRSKVDDAGPGSAAVKNAVDEYNAAFDAGGVLAVQEAIPLAEEFELATPENGDNVLLMKCGSWLMFSAPTGWFGNVGQGNYCAANIQLDQNTFSHRQQMATTYFEPITMMWGAVANLGMRWKAFASQDFLANGPEGQDNGLMDHNDASGILRCLVMPENSPEWTTGALGYKDMQGFFITNWNQDPWGWGKGKGGGLTLRNDDIVSFHDMKVAGNGDGEKDSWLFLGRRVRIQGLEKDEEMNGMKGTLIEEVSREIWHVQLDDGAGDKLLHSKNMVQIHTSAAPVEAEAKAAPTQSQEQMCLAGTWDDWTPSNMQFDEKLQCHIFDVSLNGATRFAVSRGQAGTRKWKPGALKKWSMGSVAGRYRIKVFVADSKIGNVEWEALAA